MYESEAEIADLQKLLDRSMSKAGAHVRSIFTTNHWLSARQVCAFFQGVKQVAAATVSSKGEPRVAPIDAVFYHGRFCLSTDARSLRARRLAERPSVSVTYFEGADPVIIVHGKASFIRRGDREFGALDSEWEKAYGNSITELSDSVVFIGVEPKIMLAYSFHREKYPDDADEVVIGSPSVSEWKEFKRFRLRALKKEPQAFGSSFERESAYPDEKWRQRIRGIAEGESYVLVARQDGKPVGMVMGGRTDGDRSGHSAHVWGLYVQESVRRRGVARALMERVIAGFAANRDIEVVKLDVSSEQEAAKELYLKLGFKETGTSRWKMGDGLEHQVTSLEKRLRKSRKPARVKRTSSLRRA